MQGVSVQGDLSAGGLCEVEVSVQGGLCLGGTLSRGGLCPVGGLCPGESLL